MIDEANLSNDSLFSKFECKEYKTSLKYVTCMSNARKFLNFNVHGNSNATGLLILGLYLKLHKYESNIEESEFNVKVSSLASVRGINRRTVQRHISILLSKGFFIDKIKLGKEGILLKFNGQILFSNATNCHSLVQVPLVPINNNKDQNPREQVIEPREQVRSETNFKRKSIENSEQLLSLNRFWNTFKKGFYSGRLFSEIEEKSIKNIIWEGVYNKFHLPFEFKDWNEFEKSLYQRLRILDIYLRKKPDKRFITSPLIYFDKFNPNGFSKTYYWNLRETILKKVVQNTDKKPSQAYFSTRIKLNQYHDWQVLELSQKANLTYSNI
ncbi:MAG: hypothetical protein SFY32_16705 [Bacteroidota bacterium]|nr:hypothetical protein [Bacteroidota bacterium]